MTVDGLIETARARGYRLSVRGGRLVVNSSGTRDSTILAELRARKAELLASLARHPPGGEVSEESERSQRLGEVPTKDLALAAEPPVVAEDQVRGLLDHVQSQDDDPPGPVMDWLMARAIRYSEVHPSWTALQQEVAAANDLVAWQSGG